MNTNINNSPISPAVIKSRCPRIARQMAWMSPGLGHMYLGQLVRGLWFSMAVVTPIVIGLILLLRGIDSVAVYAVLVSVTILISLYSVWDVILMSRKTREDYRLKDYNRASAYILMFAVPTLALATGLAVTVRNEVVSPYKVTADLPEMNISAGDYVISAKKSYDSSAPAVGDRFIFNEHLRSSKAKVGIVKAVAGDTISGEIVMDQVPQDHVLISYMGEDDALHDRVISSYAIEGKVVYRVWPLKRFGSISDK